jgi:hypothetical protein
MTLGAGSGAMATTLSDVDAGADPSAVGVNDAVCIRPRGVAATSSRSRCPQYMQNDGGSAPSAVESERVQRGQVTVIRVVSAGATW